MNSTEQFNIAEAASRSGVSAKMARHHESLGLLPGVTRTDAGYRRNSDKEVHTLRFIRCGNAQFAEAPGRLLPG